jgi:hypothetical protein
MCRAFACVLGLAALWCGNARADDASMWREIETKYIFGFTEGSGIGIEGEKEISLDTTARLGKRGTGYWGSETKLEFEYTPNQYIQLEFGPFISHHNIKNIIDLNNLNQTEFGGFFGEARYLLVDRTSSQPLSVTLSGELERRLIDETDGARVNNWELELKINADLELIRNQLYLGMNLLYEPEATKDPDHIGAGWEKESKLGGSLALAYRVTPTVVLGAEGWYLRHYDGAFFNIYTGDAFYLGPTFFWQIAPKMFVAAAWSTQLVGHEVDAPLARLNLAEFSRQRARLKLAFEF